MTYPAFSTPAPATARIALELNAEEAQVIADILSAVDMTPGTRSDLVMQILSALEEVGIEYSEATDMYGHIGFE